MRIIDDKGRIFGVVNIFDLCILFTIFLTALFIYRWVMTAEDPSWVKFKLKYAKAKCYAVVIKEIAELVKEGDVFTDNNGTPIGKVKKIFTIEPANVATYVSKDGEKIFFSQSGMTVMITFAIDILVYEKDKRLYYYADNTTPFANGMSLNLKTSKYEFSMTVIKIIG